jgi:hypothetical protein
MGATPATPSQKKTGPFLCVDQKQMNKNKCVRRNTDQTRDNKKEACNILGIECHSFSKQGMNVDQILIRERIKECIVFRCCGV